MPPLTLSVKLREELSILAGLHFWPSKELHEQKTSGTLLQRQSNIF